MDREIIGPQNWRLPEGSTYWQQTETFTSIPSSMKLIHHTRGTVYRGVLKCTHGSLAYIVFDAPKLQVLGDQRFVVPAGDSAIIYPQAYFRLENVGSDTSFYMEFWKPPI